jgi:hypothetical protein
MRGFSDCFLRAKARRPELGNSVSVLLGQLLPPYFSCSYGIKYAYVTRGDKEKRE